MDKNYIPFNLNLKSICKINSSEPLSWKAISKLQYFGKW
jgi:hypothetical protein